MSIDQHSFYPYGVMRFSLPTSKAIFPFIPQQISQSYFGGYDKPFQNTGLSPGRALGQDFSNDSPYVRHGDFPDDLGESRYRSADPSLVTNVPNVQSERDQRLGVEGELEGQSEDDLFYKRLVANGQERRRMHRLNVALEELRKVIPIEFHGHSRRLSKIKTLRTAISYIAGLKTILNSQEPGPQNAYFQANYSPYPCLGSRSARAYHRRKEGAGRKRVRKSSPAMGGGGLEAAEVPLGNRDRDDEI